MNNCEKCGYYSDGECNICGMGMSGEDTFCRLCKDNSNCYYKQLFELKAENERLKKEIKIKTYCVDITDCKLKQIVEKCKEHPLCDCACGDDILQLLDIQEVE